MSEKITKLRYDPVEKELTEDLRTKYGKSPSPDTNYSEELYKRVGERFRVEWPQLGKSEPIIHLDTLAEASESDVLEALNDMADSEIL